jgi:hypothetical protein
VSHLWNAVGLYPEAVLRVYGGEEVDQAIGESEKLQPLVDELQRALETAREAE